MVNWNSEAPLKLLQSMPAVLTLENLRIIQEKIDEDKYVHSKQLKHDLCGEYAPFCEYCDKSIYKYPCAVAYVRMKQLEGMQVEIAITEEEPQEPKKAIRIAVAKRKR